MAKSIKEKQTKRLNKEMSLIANKANLEEVEQKKILKLQKERKKKDKKFSDQVQKNKDQAMIKQFKVNKVSSGVMV